VLKEPSLKGKGISRQESLFTQRRVRNILWRNKWKIMLTEYD
jgi:hypothetical protein